MLSVGHRLVHGYGTYVRPIRTHIQNPPITHVAWIRETQKREKPPKSEEKTCVICQQTLTRRLIMTLTG